MIYLSGDNNLAPYACNELNSLLTTTSELEILVLFDGASCDDSVLYRIHDGSSEMLQPPFMEGEFNMGDGATLATFIQYVYEHYPAHHYALELWGHGNGWLGYSNDMGDTDMLSLDEIKNAIGHVDVLLFSACYMGTLETAYALKDTADYLVACEGPMPVTGLSSKAIFEGVNSVSPEELAVHIVDVYAQHNGHLSSAFAAWNLSRLPSLTSAITSFSAQVEQVNAFTCIDIRNMSAYSLSYIDLYMFAHLFYEDISMEAAQDIMSAVNETVMACFGEMAGIGVYFPLPAYFSGAYCTTDFAMATPWDELVASF